MTAIHHRASHPIFDIEEKIIDARNQPCPVDLAPWQERIDQIAGQTADGLSNIRIVWGQDSRLASMWSFGRERLKYVFYRYSDGGEIIDIGNPRFYVEELHPKEELEKDNAWEKTRYKRTSLGIIEDDVLGPIPETGFYTAIYSIAFHDELCCDGREIVNHTPCLGAYRPPTDTDIQRIRRMVSNRDHASNAERAPTQAQWERRAAEATKQRDEQWRKPMRAAIDDWFARNRWKFTEHDPTALAWGKFHFTAAHNKSGLKKEENNVSSNSDATD